MTRVEKRQQQIARVDAFKAWLRAGARSREIPAVPRNCDFKVWREARKVAT